MNNDGPGSRFFIVDEDQLRQKVIDLSPELQRDTQRMADLIRELVNFEREKAGLDNPRGTLELWLNKEQRTDSDPQWVGVGRVAGRHYLVSAWVKNQSLKVMLLPRKVK
jgi:hypothetical protein